MNLVPHASLSACLAIALTACAGMTTSVVAQSAPFQMAQTLQWSTGDSDRVVQMTSSQIQQALVQLANRPQQTRVLVHLSYPVSASERQMLKDAGLALTTPLGGTSYFATLDRQADISILSKSAVAAVSSVNISHKLHQDLQAGLLRPWMFSQEETTKSIPLKQLVDTGLVLTDELTRWNLDPSIVVLAMFHADANAAEQAKRLAADFGVQILSSTDSINTVSMAIKPSQIEQIAADDAIMWIEPPLPPMSTLNASNRELVEANTLNNAPYGLDGSGVTVLVYDAGAMFQHNDFGSRLAIGATDTSGTSNHATHVGGTIGGDGSGNINHRGMAPGVDIISFGFEQEGGLQEGFLYSDPGDIEADYTQAILTYGAHIANNSIGTNTAPNGFPCDWTGNYGVTSALIDTIAQGSTGDPFRIVWANGNERQTSRCGGDDSGNHGEFYSTAPPACAKNHITVGSVDSNSDLTSSFSSWGPTDDGRIKPDISAPGCQTNGDNGVTSTSSSGGYTTMCGTSMASPTVAGISALIMQQYRATFPDRPEMTNATLKTILANSAQDRGNEGPDYKYGYGSIRGVPAVDSVIAGNVIESDVVQGGVYRAIIIVEPGQTELRVTAAWDDAPAAPNVTTALVNDLDLRVIDSNNNIHFPWTLDPANPNAPAVQSAPDHLNNIEQVSVMNPAPGAYTVEVTGFNIASGLSQSFGLTSSSTLINCSSAGIVSVGGAIFSCVGSTTVQVVDCDLNTSDLILDTVDVSITSGSQLGGPLVLTLVETAPESATFMATISFADTSGSADIIVSEGDTITATYIDANDGNGNTNVTVVSSATIDCLPPVLLGVSVPTVEPRDAVVNPEFDEPASVTVHYGTSIFSLSNSVSSNAYLLSPTINISGLQDQTIYYYTLEFEDIAGNTASDDNGGNAYTFTTPDIPDFFTEEFTNGIDLQGLSLTLTPSNSIEGYSATIDPLDGGVLPYVPSAGTRLVLSDDDSEPVTLADGKLAVLYGLTYTTMNIGSNGYVTFGAVDYDYSETLPEHFDTPRVSLLFDDLNPSTGGDVYYQQLTDRMVVSYDRVPEYSSSNQNTAQIEFHFDGTIVMSWERIDTGDAIVGISQGLGQNPDFVESDLSNYPSGMVCQADINGDGKLSFFDVSAFVAAFGNEDPIADLNGDGQYNFFDVSAFVAAYQAGCP